MERSSMNKNREIKKEKPTLAQPTTVTKGFPSLLPRRPLRINPERGNKGIKNSKDSMAPPSPFQDIETGDIHLLDMTI
jgi:hypothetical protein